MAQVHGALIGHQQYTPPNTRNVLYRKENVYKRERVGQM